MKAKFIRKYYGTGYERNFVYMDYEYRGYTYTVYENLGKGNEPLSWQHKTEQDRIDRIIEIKEKSKNEKSHSFDIDDLDKIFEEWDNYENN